jgi:hypothetical protein
VKQLRGFIEPFVIATKRQLPKNHHLRVLLEPHFEGTILINYGAHKLLIADQGQVDALLAGTIESDRQLWIESQICRFACKIYRITAIGCDRFFVFFSINQKSLTLPKFCSYH